jgi:L-lactate dehydrogenase complex protein LldF
MPKRTDFNVTIEKALAGPFLQKALERATSSFKGMRTRAVAEYGYFEELRRKARAAKERALGDLDRNLVRLEESVLAYGGHVHWAQDGRSAIDYVTKLAAEKGVRTVVKGKSMTTEEIDFNPGLEKAGLEVFETDLGEYIVQQLGERPSHIIGPAIHKTKEEVGRLLEEKLGIPYTDNPEVMTAAVRETLRSRFLNADMGVTGGNFAVAETGTVVLFENEGNIRMSTTLPRILVSVVGVEKVIADWNDLDPLLRILPLAAVGQRLPSYVSFLTGPGRKDGVGPEEFHLVLLDGFRSKIMADPVFRPLLRCIRCGSCLNFCPVYRRIGGHSYPWIYSGPIGACLTGAALGPEAARDVVGATTLCKACAEVCPVMIDLPGILLDLRRRLAENEPALGAPVTAMAKGMAAPFTYDLIGRAMGLGTAVATDSEGRVRLGPEKLKRLGRGRRLPKPDPEPFHRSLFRGDEE